MLFRVSKLLVNKAHLNNNSQKIISGCSWRVCGGDNQPDLSKIEQRRGTGRGRLAAERRGSSLAPFPKMPPASPPN
jgi:hypothetical protein